MRYNITVEGIGQSIHFSSLSDEEKFKIESYCKNMGVSLNEAIFNDLKEILGSEWFEICNHDSIYGVIPDQGSIKVYDEFDKIVFDRKISEIKSIVDFMDYEDSFVKENPTTLFCINRKTGNYLDEFVNLKEKFNPTKLEVIFDSLEMNDGRKFYTCVGVQYENIIIIFDDNPDVKYYSSHSEFI